MYASSKYQVMSIENTLLSFLHNLDKRCLLIFNDYQMLTVHILRFIVSHSNSGKAPDMTLWPSVILEAGYAELWQDLVTDWDLWSIGPEFQVNVIIPVKIYQPSVVRENRSDDIFSSRPP